ncbi:helix-turn-helix transcriptional regulator [Pseudorhizobium pelagicum]|nr:helix-turn-helix transcriptional regulator [Pseudorhizobium pelagicum]
MSATPGAVMMTAVLIRGSERSVSRGSLGSCRQPKKGCLNWRGAINLFLTYAHHFLAFVNLDFNMPYPSGAPSSADPLGPYVDLQSVPRWRRLTAHPFIERMRLAVAFDYIAVSGLDIDGYRFGQAASIDSDFPPAFLDAYAADGLFTSDPFVLAAKGGSDGIVIESEIWKTHEPGQRLLYLTRTFKVQNRTLFPVMRNEIMYGSVCFTRSTPFDEDELNFLSLVAGPIHTTVTEPLMKRFATGEMKLSKGELACLWQASRGLTSEEIATATGYQQETVNSYIKSAVKKLGCSNRTQAIAEAIRRRIIP